MIRGHLLALLLSSKVVKSQVDTIAIVTELIHYQCSKASKSQVDTIFKTHAVSPL